MKSDSYKVEEWAERYPDIWREIDYCPRGKELLVLKRRGLYSYKPSCFVLELPGNDISNVRSTLLVCL